MTWPHILMLVFCRTVVFVIDRRQIVHSSSSFSRSLTKRDLIRLAKAAAAMTAIGVVPTRLIR